MRKKKTDRRERNKTDPMPRSDAANLIKAEADTTDTSDGKQQRNADEAISNPSRRLGQVLVWLHLKQRSLTVWLPVIISAVLLIVTWVYARYAKKQWQATVEQGETMKRSLYVSERAYVAIDSIQVDLDKGEVTIKLHNIGKSPAGDLEFHTYIMEVRAVKELTLADRRTLGNFDSDWGHTYLYPGSLKSVVVMSFQNFTQDNAESVRMGKHKLFIGGSIHYWDGFRKAEPYHFFYRYVAPPYDLWLNAPLNTFEELQQMK